VLFKRVQHGSVLKIGKLHRAKASRSDGLGNFF
jgi:hypothetical protein